MTTSTLVREIGPCEIIDDISRRGLLRAGATAGVGMTLGVPVLAGCDPDGEPATTATMSPPPRPTGVLRVANNAEPASLDPALAAGYNDIGIISHNIYESLLRLKGDTAEVEGVLAESFESSPDAREWVFRLRSDITFHDGEPLTSAAVKTSFEHYVHANGLWSQLVPPQASYDDSDPRVLRITTKTPFPDMARNAAMLRVISPKLVAAGADAVARHPTGTGPFQFDSYTTAKNVVLKAYPDFRGPGPYLERIDVVIIPDPSARAAALRSGAVDLVRRMSATDVGPLRGDDSIVVKEKEVWADVWLALFVNYAPADNVRFRQAVAYAIDRQAIVNAILGGVAGKVVDGVMPPGIYGYSSPDTQYKVDLDRARQLLAESGLRTPIDLQCAWVSDSGGNHGRVLQAIKGMLEKVDINLSVRPVASTVFGKIVDPSYRRPYQGAMVQTSWTTASPLFFTVGWFKTICELDNPTFNELQRTMLVTADGPKRRQLMAEMQEYLARELPVIPLYSEVAIDAHRRSIQGYVPPKDGIQPNYSSVYLSE